MIMFSTALAALRRKMVHSDPNVPCAAPCSMAVFGLFVTRFFQVMIFIGGRNLALSMLCNIIPPVGLFLFTSKSK